jgi:hypothetical protein
MSECIFLQRKEKEDAAHRLCRKFRVFVDAKGDICHFCRNNKEFRKNLERLHTLKKTPYTENETLVSCDHFGATSDAELCAQCRSDTIWRLFLYIQRDAENRKPKRSDMPCPHQGEVLRVETRRRCGGKIVHVPIFHCDIYEEAGPEICRDCAKK